MRWRKTRANVWGYSQGKGGFREFSSPQLPTLSKPFHLSVTLQRREEEKREKREERKFGWNDGSWVVRSGVSQSRFKSFYSLVM